MEAWPRSRDPPPATSGLAADGCNGGWAPRAHPRRHAAGAEPANSAARFVYGMVESFEANLASDAWPAGIIYQDLRTVMAMTTRSPNTDLLLFTLLALAAMPARASFFSLAASGTISSNSSGDPTIPIGTPWTFELTYDTAAPDLDFELTSSPDPTFGRFTNSAAPPALTFFHYQAGGYEATIDDPADFGTGSEILITFTNVNAIDINVNAPAFFPPLTGGLVSFHADFNAFSSAPIFSSDALPTNTTLGPESFDQSTVTLLPPTGVVSGSSLTSLTLMPVPEPSKAALQIVGLLVLRVVARRARRPPAHS
jgi:hypothetical protein